MINFVVSISVSLERKVTIYSLSKQVVAYCFKKYSLFNV